MLLTMSRVRCSVRAIECHYYPISLSLRDFPYFCNLRMEIINGKVYNFGLVGATLKILTLLPKHGQLMFLFMIEESRRRVKSLLVYQHIY